MLAAAFTPTFSLISFCQPSAYPKPILQTGETGQAWSVDLSPDGALFVAADDHSVSLWDREHKWLLRHLSGHTSQVQAVAFDRQGKTIASGSESGELATWDVETGARLKMRSANSSAIHALKFTSDGKILTAGWDQSVRLWDDDSCSQSCVLVTMESSPMSMALTKDNSLLAIGDTANRVTIWRLDIEKRSAHLYQTLDLPSARTSDDATTPFVRGLAFDSKGLLAAVNFDGELVVQDVGTWTTLFAKKVDGVRLDGVAFGSDSKQVFVAGSTGAMGRLLSFNINDGSRGSLFEAPVYWTQLPLNMYRSLIISQNGRWLIAGGTDFMEWDLAQPSVAPTIFSISSRVIPGTFLSPTGSDVVIPVLGIHLFSILRSSFTALPSSYFVNPMGAIVFTRAAQSRDGRFIASPGLSREYLQFELAHCGNQTSLERAACIEKFAGKPGTPAQNALLIFRQSDMQYIAELESDEEPFPVFSERGDLLVWRVKAGLRSVETKCFCNLQKYDLDLSWGGYFDLALDATAQYAAVPKPGTRGRAVLIYNLESRTDQTLPLDEAMRTVVFNHGDSPQSRYLAIGTTSGNTYVHHLSDSAVKALPGSSPVTALSFNHDGTRLAIGRENGTLSLISLDKNSRAEESDAHAGAVDTVSFGLGDRWIASTSHDAVQFWSARDLSSIGTLILPPKENTLSWIFVAPGGLFEGEARAFGNILWRFSPKLYDVGPVELFAHDYYCQGLLEHVLLEAPGTPQACRQPTVTSRNRHLPKVSVTVDWKDRSQFVKVSRVKVEIKLDRFQLPGQRPEDIKDVRLFRNGVLVKHWHGVIAQSVQELQTDAPVTPGVNEFTANAFNADDVQSLDSTDGIVGDKSLARPGTTYIFSIGVTEYATGIPSLHYSGNDANAFAYAVASIQPPGRSIQSVTLIGKEATRENILCGLRRLRSEGGESSLCSVAELNRLSAAQIEDSVFLYFSGHGVSDSKGFALLPHDAFLARNARGGSRLGNQVSTEDLETELEPIWAAQQILVLDACNAASIASSSSTEDPSKHLNSFGQLAREKGMYILAAATARQSAAEVGQASTGIQSRSILNFVLTDEGILKGKASHQRPSNALTVHDWFDYAVSVVPSTANQQPVSFLPMSEETSQTETVGYLKTP
jgi:WD40 repeat protein